MFATTALTSQLVAPAALKQSAFRTKSTAATTVKAGKTIDTNVRKDAMKAKQDADRKKATAAAAAAKKLADANKAAAAKTKLAAVAERKRKDDVKKAGQAKYNSMNKTVGGSSKLIAKKAPFAMKDPLAGRVPKVAKKDDGKKKKFLGLF
jgi:hypothetical protein|tara:strand:- start:1139 stop:1588 length:450 start_codon:yes stop_codon:yes gene_type:complete|eukprot:CAMPEP_0119214910 /NCGR_PEP_ID=MMETSP1327-20130426/10792_1 /TAXON_ID=38833 /ORGANISM="Micromonas pusilla, Strain RCC2306" /LENGTH=149 /DNA_ID=CAMNT_0007212679 /DNA_START=30 /DNA_END=479 /DNA_ORIENTATION=+